LTGSNAGEPCSSSAWRACRSSLMTPWSPPLLRNQSKLLSSSSSRSFGATVWRAAMRNCWRRPSASRLKAFSPSLSGSTARVESWLGLVSRTVATIASRGQPPWGFGRWGGKLLSLGPQPNWLQSAPSRATSTSAACQTGAQRRSTLATTRPSPTASCGSRGRTKRKSLLVIRMHTSRPPSGKLNHQSSQALSALSGGLRCTRAMTPPTSTSTVRLLPNIAGSNFK